MGIKHLVGLTVTAFVLSGCAHVSQTSVSQPSTAEENQASSESVETMSDEEVVTLTDAGFVPNTITITIEEGESVTFVNESDTEMWVASAVHPTHEELPGFDQLKGSGKGTTYTYIFLEVGEWGYHNHLMPSQRGTVVVESD